MWARDEDEWIRMGVTEKGAGLSGAPPQAPNRSKGISGPLGAGFQKGVSKIRVYIYTHTHTHTRARARDRSYAIVVVDIPQRSVINLTLCT